METRELTKQETPANQQLERTRNRRTFLPTADIYETANEIIVLADMPGVDEKNVNLTLERNVLTIDGDVDDEHLERHTLTYQEYSVGDYHRAFTLSNEVDREHIEASVKDGVLRLVLPKAEPAKAKKISVRAG
jgi:HSP20 family protein